MCDFEFNCCNNQTIGCKIAFEMVNRQLLCIKKEFLVTRGMVCEWLKTVLENNVYLLTNVSLICALFHVVCPKVRF